MNVQEIANELVDKCRQGKWDEVIAAHYSPNCVSIEPEGQPFPARTEGLEAIKAKGEMWQQGVQEFHGMEIDGPIVAGNHFSCTMKMDITMKDKPRAVSEEICVYEVKDGKIISEQFFYPIG